MISTRGYGFLWNNPALGRVTLGLNRTEWVANSTKPVSYTHLDVYKRQPCLLEMNNVRIEAVCDIIEARAESVAQKFNIPNWYTNYHRMVSDIDFDAVFILVPPDQTFRITYDCLNYGLDIFVEKPLGRCV